MIRKALPTDSAAIARIYNHYVEHTVVTFEEAPVADEEIERRMGDVELSSLPFLVWDDGNAVRGFAYATPWKGRSAYRFSVETTVYVRPGDQRKGIGRRLYAALFAALKDQGNVHAVIGGIALPNDASVALHDAFGMTKVAHFNEVGFKLGRWVDVAYWEIILPVSTS